MVLILMGNGDTLRDENSFRLSEHCHKPKIIPKNYFRETKCMKKPKSDAVQAIANIILLKNPK